MNLKFDSETIANSWATNVQNAPHKLDQELLIVIHNQFHLILFYTLKQCVLHTEIIYLHTKIMISIWYRDYQTEEPILCLNTRRNLWQLIFNIASNGVALLSEKCIEWCDEGVHLLLKVSSQRLFS